MKRMICSRALVGVLALGGLVVLAACSGDDPVDVVDNEYTFVYEPGSTTPNISSIVVRGSFNDWTGDALAMTQNADGTWEVTEEFEPGTYEYKYVFNGDQWASNMCNDATWGNSANGNRVDPNVTTCVDDGHGGQNAQLVIPID